MRVRRLVGVGLLAAAAALANGGSPADAADFAEAGWWSRLPLAPAGAESGQLVVSGAPDGATAIAAVRYELDDDEASPVLTLGVSSDQGGADAVLAACITGSAWTAADGGPWEQKPAAACDQGSVQGVRAEDGATWTFALGPLSVGTLLDVVLVPGVVAGLPEGLNGSTFSLVFDPPTNRSVVTTPGRVADVSSFEIPSLDSPPTHTPAAPPAGGEGFSAPPLVFDAPPAVGTGFTPALPVEDQGLTATAPAVQAANPPLVEAVAAAATTDGAARTIGVLGLVLAAVASFVTVRQPSREPKGLGPFAT